MYTLIILHQECKKVKIVMEMSASEHENESYYCYGTVEQID